MLHFIFPKIISVFYNNQKEILLLPEGQEEDPLWNNITYRMKKNSLEVYNNNENVGIIGNNKMLLPISMASHHYIGWISKDNLINSRKIDHTKIICN